MTLQEIKTEIEKGNNVYYQSLSYSVVLDSKGQYLIKCGSHCIGLTWADNTTLNGKEAEFFTATSNFTQTK